MNYVMLSLNLLLIMRGINTAEITWLRLESSLEGSSSYLCGCTGHHFSQEEILIFSFWTKMSLNVSVI